MRRATSAHRWSYDVPGSAQPLATELTVRVGLYPIVTLQYSSTALYQVSYHIR